MDRKNASSRIICWIRYKSIGSVAAVLLTTYVVVNLVFGLAFFVAKSSSDVLLEETAEQGEQSDLGIFDCVYFSFVTAATIGYGDIYPISGIEKAFIVIQSVFCAVFIAMSMSIITSKLMWPTHDTLIFSKKVIYDKTNKMFGVRVINTSALPIVNPDVRISVTQHVVGDVIAQTAILSDCMAKPQYIDRHDWTMWFGTGEISFYGEDDESEKEEVYIVGELLEAIAYQKETNKSDSRFRITITISGSNGVQNFAEIKKYTASDFVKGTGFKAIAYGGKDQGILGINYRKIPGFWQQFDAVENEEEIKELVEPAESDELDESVCI